MALEGSEPSNNGNLTYDGTQAYTYDAWNRLKTVAHAYRDGSGVHSGQVLDTMTYDALNRRIVKALNGTGVWDGTSHYYFDGDNVMEERNGSNEVKKELVWGATYIDELVCDYANGSFDYFVQDANWNVQGMLDIYGDIEERYEYTPYGQRMPFTANYANDFTCYEPMINSYPEYEPSGYPWGEFGFQGLQQDEESGLVYARNRYLNPGLGRWMTREPFGGVYIDGPNLYGLLRANPLNSTDALGLYGPAGHFWTVYMVAIAAGMSPSDAYTLAFYSQYPDETSDLDAIHRVEDWYDNGLGAQLDAESDVELAEMQANQAFDEDDAKLLHSLHGGDPHAVVVRRSCLQKLLTDPSLSAWEHGFVAHALGDAWSHTKADGSAHGFPMGHLDPLAKDLGHSVDLIASDPVKYNQYLWSLFAGLGGYSNPKANPGMMTPIIQAGYNQPLDEGKSSALMMTLAQQQYGYNHFYRPGLALDPRFSLPSRDMVRGLLDKMKRECCPNK